MRHNFDGSFELNKIEIQIITQLYRFRLLSVEQLVNLIHPELVTQSFPQNPKNDTVWRKSYSSKRSRIDKEITNLITYNFVEHRPYKVVTGRRSLTIYTLANEMLDTIKELLNIPYEHFGSGWNQDLGDLSVDFYSYPKRIEHHIDSVNFYIRMTFVSKLLPFTNKIDYVDNIYAAKKYQNNIKSDMKIKPDGEIKIFGYQNNELIASPGLHAWVEIDRSTETGGALILKFENYLSYLNSLQSQDTYRPSVIIVYTTASSGLLRRWHTFMNSYQSRLFEYSSSLNMLVCNVTNLEETIMSYLERNQIFAEFKRQIDLIAKLDMGFKGQVHMGTRKQELTELQMSCQNGLGWTPQFTITENNPTRKLLYLYLKYDVYESQGISRVVDFVRKQNQLGQVLANLEIVPVFYFKNGLPKGTPKTLDGVSELEMSTLHRALWYSTSEQTWYNECLQHFSKESTVNPLTYVLHLPQ